MTVDLAVVGAGPAGLAATAAAAERGLTVALIDAGERPGGQYWRSGASSPDAALYHSWSTFRRLEDRIDRHRVLRLQRHAVWAIERTADGFAVHCLVGPESRQNIETVTARALVLATGAYDRQLPFPGWDLPGVMTAGGVQALLKGHGVVAGKRVVVAGTGPFLLPVAAGLVRCGAAVPLVAEASTPIAFTPREILRASRKLAEAGGYAATLLRHRTAFRSRHAIVRAVGGEQLEAVVIARLDRSGHPLPRTERLIACDVAAVGWGFTPQLELHLQLGCATRVDVDGSLVVDVDDEQRTGTDGVWSAGESTGVGGAELALAEGELAGRSVAGADAGLDRLRRRRADLRAFAAAMHRVYRVPEFLWGVDDGTVVCRCEEVTAGAVRRAVGDLGATDARSVKLLARPGMGWCQGRVCGFAAAGLAARCAGRAPGVDDLLAFAQRPIAAPISLGALAEQAGRL